MTIHSLILFFIPAISTSLTHSFSAARSFIAIIIIPIISILVAVSSDREIGVFAASVASPPAVPLLRRRHSLHRAGIAVQKGGTFDDNRRCALREKHPLWGIVPEEALLDNEVVIMMIIKDLMRIGLLRCSCSLDP